mmetsp:Transcript_117048/g.342846  ORF Transcript_117048/g.342846 Transcript_117048/m.342846 type:complete len:234 (+) Transcript_117048:341-1042(+)
MRLLRPWAGHGALRQSLGRLRGARRHSGLAGVRGQSPQRGREFGRPWLAASWQSRLAASRLGRTLAAAGGLAFWLSAVGALALRDSAPRQRGAPWRWSWRDVAEAAAATVERGGVGTGAGELRVRQQPVGRGAGGGPPELQDPRGVCEHGHAQFWQRCGAGGAEAGAAAGGGAGAGRRGPAQGAGVAERGHAPGGGPGPSLPHPLGLGGPSRSLGGAEASSLGLQPFGLGGRH